MILIIRLLTLLLPIILVFADCSIISTKKVNVKNYDDFQWNKHQKEILNLSNYKTKGRIVYLSEKQKVYARFLLQQTSKNHYYFLITNLLGGTELEVNTQPGIVELISNKGKHYISNNIFEEEIVKLIGIHISLNNLYQWIIGLPGNAKDYKLDNQYRLSEINCIQNNKKWKIIYGNYAQKIKPSLPLRIEFTNTNQSIKLKMDNWIIK